MAELVQVVIQSFPQILFLTFTVIAAAVVLREFRSIRSELSRDVETQVKAQFGAQIGDISRQIEQARTQAAQGSQLVAVLERERDDFQSLVGEAQKQIRIAVEDARKHAADVMKLLPKREDLPWISPRDLVSQARGAESWNDAYQFLASIDDRNATSGDLELAGDLCRDPHRFFEKAIDFYERAVSKDPENLTARAELLALIAETRASDRTRALSDLRDLVVGNSNSTLLGRYANTLITLAKFDELAGFCESELRRVPGSSKRIRAMLHRNLGVAYSSLGRPEDARKQYDQALEAEPDDENTLKVYVNLLREVRDLDKAWKYAQQLLDADPLDASYYRLAARVRDDKREYEAAFRLLQASLEHCETEADRIIVGTQLSRLAARMKLSESGLG